MKRALLCILLLALPAAAQAPAGTAELQRKVEQYIRHLYGLGPSITVKASAPTESPAPGFLEVTVDISQGSQSESAVFYVSRDAKHLLTGEIHDLSADPFAAVRRQIKLDGYPSLGPANARVTLVAYSDFQCPHCRELAGQLKPLLAQYPQVRFVFKDLPLVQIHPWAMTAATAARCAYLQKPEAFWTLHDLIFENQENIRPDTAWQRMLEFATQAGLDLAAYRACMASPETKQAIEASDEEARALRIANTPTVFVNGRRIVGGEPNLVRRFIAYELAAAPQAQPGQRRPQP
jgi:protein-disulfide isomerase